MMTLASVMYQWGFTDIWYAHPGPGNFGWKERWHTGIWTGPEGDLLCVKHCETNKEAEEYLSPGGAAPFDALQKAVALCEEKGLTICYQM